MPNLPPIKIAELTKTGVLDESRFFRLLSEQNNYVDTKTVKDFYMGLVRLITQELKENGVIKLPHLGIFALVKRKDCLGFGGKTVGSDTVRSVPIFKMLKGTYALTFYTNRALLTYFRKLKGKPGLSGQAGKFDPREKILGENLDSMVDENFIE